MPVSSPSTNPFNQVQASQPAALPEFDPARLADIHLPEAISFWPVAPGWWIVLALLSSTLIMLLLLKKYKKPSAAANSRNLKKLATKELQIIARDYQQHNNALETLKQLSIFMRRYVLSLAAREDVAALTDEQWLEYLDHLYSMNSSTEELFSKRYAALLLEGPYQRSLDQGKTSLIKELISELEQLVSQQPTAPQLNLKNENKPSNPGPEVIHV